MKVEMVGKKFHRLKVIAEAESDNRGNAMWTAKCDCGVVKNYRGTSLRFGSVKSCGCLSKEISAENGRASKTHGHNSGGKKSATYYSWVNMKTRCLNKRNHNYKGYGGRGIKICDRWLSFDNFLSDMGVKPEGLSINRVDNNGNYEKSNCEWSTMAEQAQNTRGNVLNWDIVNKIRSDYKIIKETHKVIAERWGLCKTTAGNIIRNEQWVV